MIIKYLHTVLCLNTTPDWCDEIHTRVLKAEERGLKVSSNFENGLNYQQRSSLKSHGSVHEREIRACCRCVEGEKLVVIKRTLIEKLAFVIDLLTFYKKETIFIVSQWGFLSHGGFQVVQ